MKTANDKTGTPRQETIRIRTKGTDQEGQVTHIYIGNKIEVAARDGWVFFWTAGREVRIGPLTPEQAEKLAEDLGYEALSEE